LEKNSVFEEDKNEIEDFEFNQDFEIDSQDSVRSPGWIRYQKRIK
jgi:DNA helicase-2/ATP-dependent DNA helicase PcrA